METGEVETIGTAGGFPPKLHPDVAPVHSVAWDASAPIEYRNGTVSVVLRGKHYDQDVSRESEDADRIAAELINDSELIHTFVTLFNKQAIRVYFGSSLTELAIRRG